MSTVPTITAGKNGASATNGAGRELVVMTSEMREPLVEPRSVVL